MQLFLLSIQTETSASKILPMLFLLKKKSSSVQHLTARPINPAKRYRQPFTRTLKPLVSPQGDMITVKIHRHAFKTLPIRHPHLHGTPLVTSN